MESSNISPRRTLGSLNDDKVYFTHQGGGLENFRQVNTCFNLCYRLSCIYKISTLMIFTYKMNFYRLSIISVGHNVITLSITALRLLRINCKKCAMLFHMNKVRTFKIVLLKCEHDQKTRSILNLSVAFSRCLI